MNVLEEMRRRDVVHVEGRILAHQDRIAGAEIDPALLAQREMIALLVAHADRMAAWRCSVVPSSASVFVW